MCIRDSCNQKSIRSLVTASISIQFNSYREDFSGDFATRAQQNEIQQRVTLCHFLSDFQKFCGVYLFGKNTTLNCEIKTKSKRGSSGVAHVVKSLRRSVK